MSDKNSTFETKLEQSDADKYHSSKNDPLVETMPSASTLKQGLCSEMTNPIEDMMNVVNLTKRVEALEISVHKLTSLLQTIIQQQKKRNDSDDEEENWQNFKTGNVIEPQKDDGETAGTTKEFKGSTKSIKKCCIKNLNPSEDLLSFPLNQISPIEQICHLQKQMSSTEGHIEDIFFACEQNDEKIDEAILSMNDFNRKIFCLKSNVNCLLVDSSVFKRQFHELSEKCEAMKKTNKSYVDDQLKLFLSVAYDEMEKLVNIESFNKVGGFKLRNCL